MLDHFKTRDGVRVGYYVDDFTDAWKNDTPVIMLHAAMGHSRRYYAMVPTLCRQFRTIRMDMRGHGESEVPPGRVVDMDHLMNDVIDLMDLLGHPAAHIVGNSAGGYVAQQLALHHPDRIKSLSLFSAPPGLKNSNALTWLPRIEKEGLRKFLADTIADRLPLDRTDPGLVTWFLDEAAKNDTPYIVNFVSYMASLDFSSEIHKIKCPVLAVAPGGETVGDTANYDSMRDNIPDITMKYYEGYPHNLCDAVPERCAQEVLQFLQARFPGEYSPLRV